MIPTFLASTLLLLPADVVLAKDPVVVPMTHATEHATVNDYSWIDRPDGKQVHGILGFASCRELTLTFDYPGNRLLLTRERLTAEEPHTMPFSTADTGSPDIRLEFDGRELVFGVDTGSKAHVSLESSLAEGLPLSGVPEKMGEVRTHFDSFPFYRTRLDGTIDLAGHPVESVELQLIDGWGRSLVGYGLLRSYAVSFDQRAGLVRFKRPPLPDPVALSEADLGIQDHPERAVREFRRVND